MVYGEKAPETASLGLYLKLARTIWRGMGNGSITDFSDALKCALWKAGIRPDPRLVDEAINRVVPKRLTPEELARLTRPTSREPIGYEQTPTRAEARAVVEQIQRRLQAAHGAHDAR